MSFDVEVGVYQAPRKANPLDGVIAQVIDQDVPEGAAPSGTVTIPKETALSTAQSKIREAARAAGMRARIRSVDEENRKITFTLHDKKKVPAVNADGTSEAEAPEDEAPKVPKKG